MLGSRSGDRALSLGSILRPDVPLGPLAGATLQGYVGGTGTGRIHGFIDCNYLRQSTASLITSSLGDDTVARLCRSCRWHIPAAHPLGEFASSLLDLDLRLRYFEYDDAAAAEAAEHAGRSNRLPSCSQKASIRTTSPMTTCGTPTSGRVNSAMCSVATGGVPRPTCMKSIRHHQQAAAGRVPWCGVSLLPREALWCGDYAGINSWLATSVGVVWVGLPGQTFWHR